MDKLTTNQLEQLRRLELIRRWIIGEVDLDMQDYTYDGKPWRKMSDDYRDNYMPEVRIHEEYQPPEKLFVVINPLEKSPYKAYILEKDAWSRIDRDDETTLVLQYNLP